MWKNQTYQRLTGSILFLQIFQSITIDIMKIEQIYTGCLSQGAYYIESKGEVAIIDPLRDVQPYIDRAKKADAKIKYIFETHFHADFVSGHLNLAKKTGAPIIYGPKANPTFETIIAKDGQEFILGDVKLKVLHTPGHTMESSTFLLIDENGNDHAIFSGDTLFLGDVGRPDLAQKIGVTTKEDLAGMLFDSLREKIMPLADEVIVYPAHGAGSACGKKMMKETVDTLGHQKKVNYALRADMTKDEFIKEVKEGLLPPPEYFPMNVKMNKEGYRFLDEIIANSSNACNPEKFELLANNSNAVILDVRHKDDYAKGHIPQSIFIGLGGSFAPWVGELIKNVEQEILLVVHPFNLVEAITRLTRVGFDNVIGYLDGGFEEWKKSGKQVDVVNRISSEELASVATVRAMPLVVDVRKKSEFDTVHLFNVVNIPLTQLIEHIDDLPIDNPFYIHCASGYRSMIASSMLKAKGIHNFYDVEGGIEAIKKTDIPLVLETAT